MVKMKVYELAKELGVESKDVIRTMKKYGYEAKSHMSTIEDSILDKVKNVLSNKKGAAATTAAQPEGAFVPLIKRIPKAQVVEDLTVLESEQIVGDANDAIIEKSKPSQKPIEEGNATAVKKTEEKAAFKQEEKINIIKEPSLTEEKPEQSTNVEIKQESLKPQADVIINSQTPVTAPKPAYYDKKPQNETNNRNQGSDKRPYQNQQSQKSTDDRRSQGQTTNSRPQGQAPSSRPQGQAPSSRPQGQAPSSRPQGQAPSSRPQGQAPTSRPQGQSQNSRPQGQSPSSRPQGQAQNSRPQGQAQNSRPQGQSQNSRPQGQAQNSRPQGQTPSSRPQGQSQNSRPQGQNQSDRRVQNNRSGARPSAVSPTPVAPVLEKPASNYRPEKKNFTKDKVFERVSNGDMNRSKRNITNNNQKYRGGKNNKRGKKVIKAIMPPVAIKKITIGETVVLGELAKSMSKTASELIKKLFELGVMATINQEIDSDTAILLATEFGVTVEFKADKSQEIIEDIVDIEEKLVGRPPVVTVMGHVDHGKTSLLDAIRKTNVIATEAGGITQHIGAYQVEINKKKITFLDTPGHEAFTAMRARGAQITDISIVVVAADDGVMPQTVEAINHSKAAGVPIIIAINKIDKPEANPDNVKQELTQYGLLCEEWGGDTIMVPVSAKKGVGIENLLEMILLVAEIGDLKANPDRQARGTIVESQLDKSRGAVATLLVQKGTLNIGDNIIAGPVFCKVRALNDDKGRKIKSAGPSVPVEVLGFSEVPSAGEIFIAVEDEKDARMVADKQHIKRREEELRKSSKVSLDDLFKQIEEGEIKELNIIIKGDVHGSIEAIQQSLIKLNTNEVKVTVIHSGVGGIRESDVMLASASNAIIIGFNVRPDAGARKAAESEEVDIRLYRVIYDAIEDVKKAMSGLLAPEFKEQIDGHAQVREIFKVPKIGTIAGCYVTDGKILRNSQVRIIRNNIVIMEGKIDSLRRFKDDVKEVATGFECGIGIENFNDIKNDDVIEAFSMEEIERKL